MRKLGTLDFIINSEEFLIFSRPSGDIEKILTRLTKLPCTTMIERMHRELKINERLFDAVDKEQFISKLKEF